VRCVISASSGQTALRLAPWLKASFSEVVLARQPYDALKILEDDVDAVSIVCVSIYLGDLVLVEEIRRRGIKNLVVALIDDSLAGHKSFSDFMNAGADDAQPLSIDPQELTARLAALIRRAAPQENEFLVRVGCAMLDVRSGRLSSEAGAVSITPYEVEILLSIVERGGSVATKEMIMSRVYKDMAGEPSIKIIDIYICKIRAKLLRVCGGRDVIETIWGRGFRYVEAGIEPKFNDARARVAG
jgi:two-component system, cell cycle response regulator CtrA